MSSQLKDDFTHKVERFEIVHSIKPSTANIPAGSTVSEVMVLRVELRQRQAPEQVLRFIAENNNHKLLFVCMFDGEMRLAVLLKKLVLSEWMPAEGVVLDLRSDNMDAFWDSLASQVAYGDKGLGASACGAASSGREEASSREASRPAVMSVEERYARDQRIAALRDEIARVDARCRKERQIGRKNQLFAQMKKLKAQLAELES